MMERHDMGAGVSWPSIIIGLTAYLITHNSACLFLAFVGVLAGMALVLTCRCEPWKKELLSES